MDYSGTVFANSDTCDGYLGFVFGYQNNKKFYAAIWRHNYLNYAPEYAAGIKGLQIKVGALSYQLTYSKCLHLRSHYLHFPCSMELSSPMQCSDLVYMIYLYIYLYICL